MRTVTVRELGAAWKRRTGRYYGNPAAYWETRHAQHRDALQGPGCIGLDEAANLADYEVKWDHVRRELVCELEGGATRVLDAGCGTGWFTQRVATLGFVTVDAVDFSASAAAIAQRNAPTSTVRVAALGEISCTEPYDVVMCIDVLFHVVDDDLWARSVDNLGALVAPRGALVIQDSHTVDGASEPAPHVRFRSVSRYQQQLPGWQLETNRTYVLPNEVIEKDLMLLRRAV